MTLRSLFVDFNSYFASVEQQDNPALRGRPVGVVPVLAETTCCIAASIEAKRFGVKTGTLVHEARGLCPDIVIVQARPAIYVHYHYRLKTAIETCIPISHVGSIDEVDCDLIGRERQRENAVAIASNIKQAVRAVGDWLLCSIGIAPNSFLAKTASDMRKPDGLVVLEEKDLPDALFELKLNDLCGVGWNMEERLRAHGIHTIEQLCMAPAARLRQVWGGIEGERFHARLHGEIIELPPSKQSSIGHSHVLAPELRNAEGANAVLKKLLQKAAMRLRDAGLVAGAMRIKVKYIGGEPWECAIKLDDNDDTRLMLRLLTQALAQRRDRRPLLAVGVTLIHLNPRGHTSGSLFADEHGGRELNTLIDRINRKYGNNKIYFGGAQDALEAAPMRISFNRIPNAALEDEADKNALWLKRLNQFKVLAEAEHKKMEEKRGARARDFS
jgi:DNA polymerase-4